MEKTTFIDITPTINHQLAVFPGDVPFTRKVSLSFEKGDHLTLSSINTTVHLGAHTDAPLHYHPQGESIHQRALSFYYGKCQVIEVHLKPNERIYPHHIEEIDILAPRVLFKTNSFCGPTKWRNDFNSLSPELIDGLHQKNVILIGLDTPSIDPAADKELLSHHMIYQKNMAILEGIDLTHVDPGCFKLIALPLKIENADASPVRAVLIREECEN